jgi:T3SS (YopN, CesT) and YbjN peptide-binding chaperone 2
MSDSLPPVRRGLAQAVAWHTIAEIVGHHAALDLRIVETHPGGGQYDGFTLCAWPWDLVASFNFAGSALLLGRPLGTPRPGPFGDDPEENLWPYPFRGITEDRGELARAIEAKLGFPPGRERPTTPTTIALAVVGELLDRAALGARAVDLRCGWHDHVDSVGAREWALALPAPAAVSASAPQEAHRHAAVRYWSLDRQHDAIRPALVVDLASSEVWTHGAATSPLYERYRQGAAIRALAWELEQALDG